jgi:hypothetical protein
VVKDRKKGGGEGKDFYGNHNTACEFIIPMVYFAPSPMLLNKFHHIAVQENVRKDAYTQSKHNPLLETGYLNFTRKPINVNPLAIGLHFATAMKLQKEVPWLDTLQIFLELFAIPVIFPCS